MSVAQLGWVIADAVTDAINWVADKIGSVIGDLGESIASIFITAISGIFYGLQMGFFVIMDVIQLLFRKVAGLDSYYYQGSSQTGDMAMDFIFNPTVQGVFWSVMAVAAILLFVTTFVAIIKSEITEKGANPKGPIIGRALKSILYFAMVPIVSILGIWFANVLLKTLDRATAVNNVSTLSGMVFQAAAAQACRAETNADLAKDFAGDFGLSETLTTYEIADQINAAFANGNTINIQSDARGDGYMWTIRWVLGGAPSGEMVASITNFQMVYYYYDLMPGFGYDYLIGFIGGFIAASMLLTSILGCMQRLFEITILFVVSPPIIAMMPLDNGNKYNTWRGEFIKRVLACYGPIIGLNLMFMVLTIIGDYTFFPAEPGYAVHNALVKMFFMIVALTSLKDFTALITNLVGGADVSAMGEAKKEGTTKMAGQILNAGARMGKAAINPLRKKEVPVRDEDGKVVMGDDGKPKTKNVRGWGQAKEALASFKESNINPATGKSYGLGSAIGGLLNKRDGFINDMLDISGVGKNFRDKAIGENKNSIANAILGQGNRDRVKAEADAKAAKDAREDAETRYAATAGKDRETDLFNAKKNRAFQLEQERKALIDERNNIDPNSERARAINNRIKDIVDEEGRISRGELSPNVGGAGGTGDVNGVANNVGDIEQLLKNGITVKLAEGGKVEVTNPGAGAGGTIDTSVISALSEAASALAASATELKSSATKLRDDSIYMSRNVVAAARELKGGSYSAMPKDFDKPS